MKVILLENVKGKGKKDDIINVSDGYAKNYLIKNKLAVMYTDGSKKVLDKELLDRKNAEDALVSDLNKVKDKLKDKTLTFKIKTGKDDKVFGNVSTKQIADELKNMGFNIDKKCINTDGNIDSLGTHKVLVKLHKKVEFYINIVLSK
jgi:large subunit ribosomal protein L9